jgi:hypothetical protein
MAGRHGNSTPLMRIAAHHARHEIGFFPFNTRI